MANKLSAICRHFRIPGEFQSGEPYGKGHINDTYRVNYERCRGIRRYILQRINLRVFPNPRHNMENIQRVSAHLRWKRVLMGNIPARPTWLELVPALDGRSYWIDSSGEYWRTYLYVENSYTPDVARTAGEVRGAGAAFGSFFRDLSDLPGPRLHDTIPDFHHTPRRLAALKAAVASDDLGRANACRPEIDFALARESLAGVAIKGLADGTLPERIIHNDTKLNNVLLDRGTRAQGCVVDLDTVMPGTVLYDFGDLVRTTVNGAGEDESDLSQVICRLDMFKALCEGYLGMAGPIMTAAEKELLVKAGPLITLELGIRFLTDYLNGDIYFKVAHNYHNLTRCRVQFKLLKEMEGVADRMVAILEEVLNSNFHATVG